MDRPEELNDPKEFDDLMENINTKLAIAPAAKSALFRET